MRTNGDDGNNFKEICTDCLDEEKIRIWYDNIKKISEQGQYNYCAIAGNCVSAVLDAIAAGIPPKNQIKPKCPKTPCLTLLFGGINYVEDVLHPLDGPHEFNTIIPLPGAAADSIRRLNNNNCNRYKCSTRYNSYQKLII